MSVQSPPEALELIGRPHEMRSPCTGCGGTEGVVIRRGMQDTVRCRGCQRFQYNAPRTETGERRVSVVTVHNGIKPKQRARILDRANGRCEVCGGRMHLHVGHIVSVKVGLGMGVEESILNDDENLMALCAECNLGRGHEPMPLRLAVAVLRARVSWKRIDAAVAAAGEDEGQ